MAILWTKKEIKTTSSKTSTMSEYIKTTLTILWITLFVVWVFYGLFSKKGTHPEPLHLRFIYYWLPLILAFYLLGPGDWFGHTLIREKFVEHTNLVGIIGLVSCFLGYIIALWSRFLLGTNWSISVQKKEDHTLITKGPYKLIRHPIYTGLLLMFSGNAIIVGDYRGIIAVIIVLLSFWFKLVKEEKTMIGIFGDQYLKYVKKTKRLIPWVI